MAGLTIEQSQERLQLYLDAEAAVLQNQAYEIAGRRLTRANLAEIQAGITLWNNRIALLQQRAAGRQFGYIRHGW